VPDQLQFSPSPHVPFKEDDGKLVTGDLSHQFSSEQPKDSSASAPRVTGI